MLENYVEYCIIYLYTRKEKWLYFDKSCGKEIPEGNELCDECAQANSSSTENTTAESTVNENTTTYETETPEATVVNDNQYNTNNSNSNVNPNPKSKLAAGLLGIFLGSLGVHNFYLGYTTKGLIQLLDNFIGWCSNLWYCIFCNIRMGTCWRYYDSYRKH